MTVTWVETDYDELTVTVIADFDAPIERVWELWSDPRRLERWWGPPNYPTTFENHELAPGGEVTYVMTGEDGDMRGTWHVTSVEPPTSLEFTDTFAGPDGAPIANLPVTTSVRLAEHDGRTRMHMRSTFASGEDMETLMSAGLVEGLRQAVGQMDALLA